MRSVIAVSAIATAAAQNAGTLTEEKHPELTISHCTESGCSPTQKQHSLSIDSNWRWTHAVGETKNCYTGNLWDNDLCKDVESCTKNCAIEGADKEYEETYGVHAKGDEVTLDFVTQGPYSLNVGSRLYVMEDDETYKFFHLKNRELTFEVNVSNLPCGLNGALYFVSMDQDGGMSKYPSNKAGAKYGTGYCDAQCPHDLKWINGEANVEDWKPSKTDVNAGTGKYGTCCTELDVWEANSHSTAYALHACDGKPEQVRCEGTQCGDNGPDRFKGMCDKNGCDLQPFRFGEENFFGHGHSKVLDTHKMITVTTQFITEDGTDSGKLVDVKRFYKEGSTAVESPKLDVGGASHSSISEQYCKDEVAHFKDGTNFLEKGGFDNMDAAMDRGMVMVVSLWDDHYANMLWLDSTYPVNSTAPGARRGTCRTNGGDPKEIEKESPHASVTFKNIRYGAIGTTTKSEMIV